MRGKNKKEKNPTIFFRALLPACSWIYPSLHQYSKKILVKPAKGSFRVKVRNQVLLFWLSEVTMLFSPPKSDTNKHSSLTPTTVQVKSWTCF